MTKEGKATLEQMYEQFRTNHNDDRADALYEALKEIETFDALKDLPSAQPEIIHCRDCKWHNREINQCKAQICASMRGEDFCSRAERREE